MNVKRFKKLRKEKNLSQRQIAEKLNLSGSTIGMYETEKRKPDSETLQKIASYFNVTTDYLLGRSDIKNPEANIPEEVKEYLNDEEQHFIIDLLKKEQVQSFLRESRGASDHDIAVAIQALKAVREGKEKGRTVAELENKRR